MNIVRFSPDGELFCTGSADCKAFLFNGKTAEEVGPLGGDKAHAGGIYGVSSGFPVYCIKCMMCIHVCIIMNLKCTISVCV